MISLVNKKFSIIGIAASGIAAAKKIKKLGGEVFLSEYKIEEAIENHESIKKEFECEFGGHTEKVLESDILVVSPGVPSNIEILNKARVMGKEVIGEIELGYRLKAKDSKLICCTGSNGKSTTVTLIYQMLKACGYNTILAGNIGTPFTSYNIENEGIDFIVLELSSFQLELIDQFKADSAIILNITPDHLNRYSSFDEYGKTKFNIFKNNNDKTISVLNLDDKNIARLNNLNLSNIKYFSLEQPTNCFKKEDLIIHNEIIYNINKISIKGPHNYMNIMAAMLAIEPYIEGKQQNIKEVLKGFSTLSHRMEFAGEIKGISFYNDSKATNTDSVKYALLSFTQPIHIILGGSDKGEDFSILLPYLNRENVHIYLIGATRSRMRETFKEHVQFLEFETMREAVISAYNAAHKGDAIVLSPACASYDSFRNFVHRGDVFKQIVKELKDEIQS